MIAAATDPPFTGLVCRHCGKRVARIVASKKLALKCPACGLSWIASTISGLFVDSDPLSETDLENTP